MLKSEEEIARMRAAGALAAEALRAVAAAVAPGVTTEELDRIARSYLEERGATPSFLHYHGYPKSICASVNGEVVHGIPGPRMLEPGDIVSLDLGAMLDGYHGDTAMTVPVGAVDPQVRELLRVTGVALEAGVAQARPGRWLSDISHAVQEVVEAAGFSVVEDFVGHGIGRSMHEDPQVPNYGPPGRGVRLRRGMVLAIEPMVNLGAAAVRVGPDGWTVETLDGRPSAHFEHTVAIGDPPQVLTASPGT